MGILSGKNIFSSKWITAEITDASNRLYYVPIKKTIGDYFLADIEGHVYCFKVDGSRVKVYQHTLVRSFRVLQYDLNHYLPISASDNKELELVLKSNGLPKMNMALFRILKMLGRREKESFTPHDLQELVNDVSEHEDDYKESVQNIKNYLTHLNVSQIVTPVRKITEFLEEDLLVTDSKFMGTIVMQHARTDMEHKKVTNSAEKGGKDWIKLFLIIGIIVIIAFAGWWIWDSGMIQGFLPTFPSGGGLFQPPASNQGIMDKYPTPESLKAAIDRGEVDYNTLPPDIKKLLDNSKFPEAIPTP
jgi:hypothetical protein